MTDHTDNVAIKATILRMTDASQPGFVECHFEDAHRHVWLFNEKVPVVSPLDLGPDSNYPQTCEIAGRLVATRLEDGRTIHTVDTVKPWGIEATTGETCFEVLEEQLAARAAP